MTIIKTGEPLRWQSWLTACLVTAACVGLGLALFDLGASAKALGLLSPGAWAGVIALSLVMAVLRATRVAVMARGARILPVVKASFLHGAANAVLPARMGEAVLPLALARYAGVDPMRAVGLLLIARLGDLVVLVGLGLLLVAVLDAWTLPPGLRIALGACGFVILASIGLVPWLVRTADRWTPRFIEDIVRRVAAAAKELARGTAVEIVILTFAIWLTLALAAKVSVAAAGLQADLALIGLACVAASLSFALPTNGLASFGPFEAAFVAVFAAAGTPAEIALTAAIHLHLCALIASGLAGLAALLFPARDGIGIPCP